MAKALHLPSPSRLVKTGIAAVFFLATCFSSFGQDLKTGKPGGTQPVRQTLKAIFKAKPSGKKTYSGTANSRMLVQSLPLNSTLYYRDQTNNTWVQTANGRYTYDAQGNQTSFTNLPVILHQMAMKDSSLFDSQGNLIYSGSYTFSSLSNSWVAGMEERNQYIYNSFGRPTDVIYVSYYNGSLQGMSKEAMVYNSAGYPTEQITYDWVNNTWVPESKILFSYTNPNNPPTTLVAQNYNNGVWTNEMRLQNVTWHDFFKFEFTYYEAQVWLGGFWMNAVKNTTTYDALGGSVEITQNWLGLAWVNSERNTNTYDSKMNFVNRKGETWQNNAWERDYESGYVLTYNANDQITERITKAWDPSSNTIKEYEKEVYSNFMVLGTSKSLPQSEVKVYPNPATDHLNISLGSKEKAIAVVTDLTGKVVLSQALQPAGFHCLNLTGLAKGSYLLKLETNKGTSIQKIIRN